MNFSFRRKSKIFSIVITSKVYCTCELKASDFFHKLGAFFTSRGQIKEPVLRRSAIEISS